MWAGVALAAVCALAFVLVARQLDDRRDVLVLARDVPRGTVLESGDLRVTRIGSGTDVPVIPVSERSAIVGKTTARGLLAGQLLQPADVAPSGAYPPAGKAEVALILKAGASPPSVRGGQHVAILEGPVQPTPGAPAVSGAVMAEVVRVDSVAGSNDSIVVTLLVDTASARLIAALREPHLAVMSPTGGDVL